MHTLEDVLPPHILEKHSKNYIDSFDAEIEHEREYYTVRDMAEAQAYRFFLNGTGKMLGVIKGDLA